MSHPTSLVAAELSASQDPTGIESIFDPATLLKRGHCLVSTSPSRSPAPHKLYYELHGQADAKRKVVFLMGLNNSCFAWHNQLAYFAGSTKPGYQVLVLDNVGVGHSELHRGSRLYKTSEMAADVVEVMNAVGFTGRREVTVVGISMGGMIALELGLLIPERINALLLTSTKSGNVQQWPSLKATYMFSRLLSGTVFSAEQAIALVVNVLFPAEYLDANGKRAELEKEFLFRYKIGKPQTFWGRFGQMGAVMTHKVSPAELKTLALTIPHIAIITGDQDELLHASNSHELKLHLNGARLDVIKGGGHALPSQIKDEYNTWVEEGIAEGWACAERMK